MTLRHAFYLIVALSFLVAASLSVSLEAYWISWVFVAGYFASAYKFITIPIEH